MRYIRMHFDEKQRGTAIGLYMTGTKLGPAIGLPLAGYLITTFNWQIMFLIMGVGGLIILIPWMFWVKPDDIAAISRVEREELEKNPATGRQASGGLHERNPIEPRHLGRRTRHLLLHVLRLLRA